MVKVAVAVLRGQRPEAGARRQDVDDGGAFYAIHANGLNTTNMDVSG